MTFDIFAVHLCFPPVVCGYVSQLSSLSSIWNNGLHSSTFIIKLLFNIEIVLTAYVSNENNLDGLLTILDGIITDCEVHLLLYKEGEEKKNRIVTQESQNRKP